MNAPVMDDTSIIEVPEPADAPAIGRLFHEDMAHLGVEVSREDLEEVAARVIEGARAEEPECLCWVARPAPEADPVGVIMANFNWSVKFGGRSLWIEELYVTPEYRRDGFGRQLVDRVLGWADDHDIKGIDLEAYQGNTPASVLYRTAGFHRLGRERFYLCLGDRRYL